MNLTKPNPRIFCAICGKQVDFSSVQRDAHGKTVHRECHEFLYNLPSNDKVHTT